MTETQQPPFDPLGSVAWPVRTARLLLRRAEPRDAEATWTFRQLPEFAQWQSGAPATFATYAAQCEQPGSLVKSLVVELDGTVIGDLMIWVQDAWAQDEVTEQARGVQADLGCGLHLRTTVMATPPKRSAKCSGSASTSYNSAASPPTASPTTQLPGGSWSG